MLTKENIKKLIKYFDKANKLSEIDNKILDYKNSFKLSYNKLKDLLISSLILVIDKQTLNKLTDNELKEELKKNINFMENYKINWINIDKLLWILKEMQQNKINDKAVILKDENNNVFQLFIKILPSNSYKWETISFVVPIYKNINTLDVLNNLEDIEVSLLIRSWMFQFITYINNLKEKWQENLVDLARWIDVTYLKIIE